jgi:hypothetical protein
MVKSQSGVAIIPILAIVVIATTAVGYMAVGYLESGRLDKDIDKTSRRQEIEEAILGYTFVSGRLPCEIPEGAVLVEGVSNCEDVLPNRELGLMTSTTSDYEFDLGENNQATVGVSHHSLPIRVLEDSSGNQTHPRLDVFSDEFASNPLELFGVSEVDPAEKEKLVMYMADYWLDVFNNQEDSRARDNLTIAGVEYTTSGSGVSNRNDFSSYVTNERDARRLGATDFGSLSSTFSGANYASKLMNMLASLDGVGSDQDDYYSLSVADFPPVRSSAALYPFVASPVADAGVFTAVLAEKKAAYPQLNLHSSASVGFVANVKQLAANFLKLNYAKGSWDAGNQALADMQAALAEIRGVEQACEVDDSPATIQANVDSINAAVDDFKDAMIAYKTAAVDDSNSWNTALETHRSASSGGQVIPRLEFWGLPLKPSIKGYGDEVLGAVGAGSSACSADVVSGSEYVYRSDLQSAVLAKSDFDFNDDSNDSSSSSSTSRDKEERGELLLAKSVSPVNYPDPVSLGRPYQVSVLDRQDEYIAELASLNKLNTYTLAEYEACDAFAEVDKINTIEELPDVLKLIEKALGDYETEHARLKTMWLSSAEQIGAVGRSIGYSPLVAGQFSNAAITNEFYNRQTELGSLERDFDGDGVNEVVSTSTFASQNFPLIPLMENTGGSLVELGNHFWSYYTNADPEYYSVDYIFSDTHTVPRSVAGDLVGRGLRSHYNNSALDEDWWDFHFYRNTKLNWMFLGNSLDEYFTNAQKTFFNPTSQYYGVGFGLFAYMDPMFNGRQPGHWNINTRNASFDIGAVTKPFKLRYWDDGDADTRAPADYNGTADRDDIWKIATHGEWFAYRDPQADFPTGSEFTDLQALSPAERRKSSRAFMCSNAYGMLLEQAERDVNRADNFTHNFPYTIAGTPAVTRTIPGYTVAGRTVPARTVIVKAAVPAKVINVPSKVPQGVAINAPLVQAANIDTVITSYPIYPGVGVDTVHANTEISAPKIGPPNSGFEIDVGTDTALVRMDFDKVQYGSVPLYEGTIFERSNALFTVIAGHQGLDYLSFNYTGTSLGDLQVKSVYQDPHALLSPYVDPSLQALAYSMNQVVGTLDSTTQEEKYEDYLSSCQDQLAVYEWMLWEGRKNQLAAVMWKRFQADFTIDANPPERTTSVVGVTETLEYPIGHPLVANPEREEPDSFAAVDCSNVNNAGELDCLEHPYAWDRVPSNEVLNLFDFISAQLEAGANTRWPVADASMGASQATIEDGTTRMCNKLSQGYPTPFVKLPEAALKKLVDVVDFAGGCADQVNATLTNYQTCLGELHSDGTGSLGTSYGTISDTVNNKLACPSSIAAADFVAVADLDYLDMTMLMSDGTSPAVFSPISADCRDYLSGSTPSSKFSSNELLIGACASILPSFTVAEFINESLGEDVASGNPTEPSTSGFVGLDDLCHDLNEIATSETAGVNDNLAAYSLAQAGKSNSHVDVSPRLLFNRLGCSSYMQNFVNYGRLIDNVDEQYDTIEFFDAYYSFGIKSAAISLGATSADTVSSTMDAIQEIVDTLQNTTMCIATLLTDVQSCISVPVKVAAGVSFGIKVGTTAADLGLAIADVAMRESQLESLRDTMASANDQVTTSDHAEVPQLEALVIEAVSMERRAGVISMDKINKLKNSQ